MISYMWDIKFGIDQHIYEMKKNRLTDTEQTCGFQGEGERGGKEWECGISRCKYSIWDGKQQGPTVYLQELYIGISLTKHEKI